MRSVSASEGRYTRLSASENQRVDIVRAFVGVYGFEVENVADDMILVRNTIAAVHVP